MPNLVIVSDEEVMRLLSWMSSWSSLMPILHLSLMSSRSPSPPTKPDRLFLKSNSDRNYCLIYAS
ncbi:MAG: hypothetical protein ACOYN8_04535 [Pseudanabaena sp.]